MFTKSAELYDAIYQKEYAAEVARLEEYLRRHKRSAGNALLDVACGTGGHIKHLRERYRVEGLDLDPSILAVARRGNPGVPFHEADMISFDLPQYFDVIACLASSIGYVRTVDGLHTALRTFARHLVPGGVALVEPWITPDRYEPGRVIARFVDEPELKVARVNISSVEGRLAVLNFHYLVGRVEGVDHFTERHELGLFTEEEYRQAFRGAGLDTAYDPHGLIGRGMYIGVKPLT